MTKVHVVSTSISCADQQMMSLTVLILLASVASLCHCFKFYIPRSLANLNGANIRGSSLGSLVSPLALRRLSTTIVDREREARTVPTVKKCRLWNDEMVRIFRSELSQIAIHLIEHRNVCRMLR